MVGAVLSVVVVLSAAAPVAAQDGVTVQTTEGPVTGQLTPAQDVVQFLGIPFAAPPVGELRWRSPRPPAVHAESLDARAASPVCPQTLDVTLVPRQAEPRGEEDCLRLNVWTPRGAT